MLKQSVFRYILCHDYMKEADVPLFYEYVGVKEFRDRHIDVDKFFHTVGFLNMQVKMVAFV